jgi:hypothetical protein
VHQNRLEVIELGRNKSVVAEPRLNTLSITTRTTCLLAKLYVCGNDVNLSNVRGQDWSLFYAVTSSRLLRTEGGAGVPPSANFTLDLS